MKIDRTRMYDALVKLCWLVVISCWVLKLFGYKEFEIPIFNYNINIWIIRIINCILYNINSYFMFMIILKRKLVLKEILISTLSTTVVFITTLFDVFVPFKMILDLLLGVVLSFIFTKNKNYKIIIESVIICLLITIYQILTMLYKNINIRLIVNGFIEDKVLQIDFYCILILTTLDQFKKGGYLYERGWKFLVLLSKLRRNKESVQQSKKTIHQEVDEEIGFKLFIVFLSIFQITIVGVSCYFINGVILEYIIIALSFFILKKVFGHCYHADTVIKCTTLSIAVFVTATRLSLPLWMSTLCNVIIGCLVAYIMYVMYYFVKFTTTTGITIHKGMCLEDLNSLCDLYNVNEIDKTILVEYYVNRKRLDTIAYKLNYSIEAVKKRKANILKKLQKPID